MINISNELEVSRSVQTIPIDTTTLSSKNSIKSNNLARARWIKCLGMVRQIVKGSFPGCLTLRDVYFKEFFDPHKIHMTKHTELSNEWENNNSKLSYFDWLNNKVDRPIHGIENISGNNRDTYKVTITNNKIIFHEKFNLEFLQEIHNTFQETKLAFIVDKDNHIYVGIKKPKIFQHASLSSWGPVKNAGLMDINRDHRLLGISNLSGHYAPKPEKMIDFLNSISEKNTLNSLNLRVWNAFAEGMEPMLLFEGQASEWLALSEKV